MGKKMIIILSFVALCLGYVDNRCNLYDLTHRDTLLGCFYELIDTNHDLILNSTELNNYSTVCCSNIPGDGIIPKPDDWIYMCDMNHDNLLTVDDWRDKHGCLNQNWMVKEMCAACYRFGWTGNSLITKKK